MARDWKWLFNLNSGSRYISLFISTAMQDFYILYIFHYLFLSSAVCNIPALFKQTQTRPKVQWCFQRTPRWLWWIWIPSRATHGTFLSLRTWGPNGQVSCHAGLWHTRQSQRWGMHWKELIFHFICGSSRADLDTKEKVLRVVTMIGKFILLLGFLYMFVCSLDILSSAFQLVGGKWQKTVLFFFFIVLLCYY